MVITRTPNLKILLTQKIFHFHTIQKEILRICDIMTTLLFAVIILSQL